MSTSDNVPGPPPPSRLPTQLMHPPVRQAGFWVVQAGVLILAVAHDVILVALHTHDPSGAAAPTTSVLLLIPVIYAALNFGMRGAVGTALWATVLVVPHWFFADELTPVHVWIETGYLLVLNVVAVIVGQRVEREQRARRGTEEALRAARDAEARYYTLFDHQPAPVLVIDAGGTVVEVNAAAACLFGRSATGRPLTELLGVRIEQLLDGSHPTLHLVRPDGSNVMFTPTAHRVAIEDAMAVQVVLSDITEQYRRQEEQRQFAARLLTAEEEERGRLARELHDDPLQQLAYLTRALEDLSQRASPSNHLADRLSHGADVANEAAIALRKIIEGLRPPVLDDLGLVSALRQLTDKTRTRTAATITLEITGSPVRLVRDLELATYRIAQEALNNVARHAYAERAAVRLAFSEHRVDLTVTDDGVGFRPGRGDAGPSGGLGLIGMQERVDMAKGTLEITALRPHGTAVHAVLPVPVPASVGRVS